MSALGQKQTFAVQKAMSALPLKRKASSAVALCCVSTTPCFMTVRKLVAAGYAPETTLVMRHAGSETYCLKAYLGFARGHMRF